MIKKIYTFSNCGYLNQLPKSGGQTSARRVMKGLQDAGFCVIPIRRHRAELEGKYGHRLETLFYAVVDAVKIFSKMLFGNRKDSAFLHLTYAGPLVPYELFLTRMVRFMGYPSMEYLKGGQVMDFYPNGSAEHKSMFKRNMDLQSLAMFEGEDSMKLASSVSNTKMVYFPNYIFDEKIPCTCPLKPEGEVNICYFGRISPDKNVHIGIEVFNLLCSRHPKWKLHYTIVGGKGKSASYVDLVKDMINRSPFREFITIKGNSTQEFLVDMMRTQHIFLFPSKEPCEGHSNSLNEAMSQGLVPIVSDYHYNRRIVGDDRCVVDSFEPRDYVDKIELLIGNGVLPDIGRQMWERVRSCFSYSVVNNTICNEIRAL